MRTITIKRNKSFVGSGARVHICILDNVNGDIDIDMSLTAPGCPVAGILPQQAADIVALVEGVGKVTVTLVWEPAWSVEKMTEEGRAIMELM